MQPGFSSPPSAPQQRFIIPGHHSSNDDDGGYDLDTFSGGVNSLALVMVGVLIKNGLPHGGALLLVNEAVDVLRRQVEDDCITAVGG